MPSKFQVITEMASITARDIASGGGQYANFLVTAANNYKYNFQDQLLIHMRRLWKRWAISGLSSRYQQAAETG